MEIIVWIMRFCKKNSASEGNESLFSDCRVQPVLFKNSASEGDETMFSDCLIRSGMYKKGCGAGPFRLTFHSIRNVPVCAFLCSAVL